MNNEHTFTILAYKESVHLQECIDSLKKQTVQGKIIICTSTPSVFLENIASKNKVDLHVNPERRGIAADWNFALEKAKTKYVTLAHQDDIYLPEYVENIIKAANSREDALIIFSNYGEIVHNGNRQPFIRKNSLNFFVKNTLLDLFFANKKYVVRNKKRLFALGNPIGCPTVTFNKENVKDFRFDENFSVNMDWKAWYDLANKKGSFLWIKKALVLHRIYSESETSHGLAENRRQKEDLEMFKYMWPNTVAKFISKAYSLSYKNNNN